MKLSQHVGQVQSKWTRTYFPILSIAIWLLSGIGAVWVSSIAPREPIFFRPAFFCFGVFSIVGAFFVPKARVVIDKTKGVLVRTSGPWPGFRTKSDRMSLDGYRYVVLRATTSRLKEGEAINKTVRIVMRDAQGKEEDLIPPACVPWRAESLGRSLAEFLSLEFQIEIIG